MVQKGLMSFVDQSVSIYRQLQSTETALLGIQSVKVILRGFWPA